MAAAWGAAAALLVLLPGCNATAPKVAVAEPTSARPLPAAPQAAVATGSIFQAGSYRPLFEEHRARAVGDTITVRIAERLDASQKSSTSLDRSGKVEAGVTALPGLAPNSFGRASAEGSSSNTFSGKGGTESRNDFSGTITATVTEVLANGHLVIAGEKQLGVNRNVEVLRFSGRVDPRSIAPGNTVASAQIADARIEFRGRGAQDEAQGIGWLARFFLNVLPM